MMLVSIMLPFTETHFGVFSIQNDGVLYLPQWKLHLLLMYHFHQVLKLIFINYRQS